MSKRNAPISFVRFAQVARDDMRAPDPMFDAAVHFHQERIDQGTIAPFPESWPHHYVDLAGFILQRHEGDAL